MLIYELYLFANNILILKTDYFLTLIKNYYCFSILGTPTHSWQLPYLNLDIPTRNSELQCLKLEISTHLCDLQ